MTKGIFSSKKESSLKEIRIAGRDFSCPLYFFGIWIPVISGFPPNSFTKWPACYYVKGNQFTSHGAFVGTITDGTHISPIINLLHPMALFGMGTKN